MTTAPEPAIAAQRGKVTAVLGPTNTGKTHFALERMLGYETGMIGLPLRLLAREIYDRIVGLKGERVVALITGEEKIIPQDACYVVCTVESMPLDRDVSFLAVDEIQLCADPERGHVFTDRLLHARGSEETMFLGAETMRGVIRTILPQAKFVTRTRFSELTHVGSRKLSRLPRRSAIVGFSAEAVYGLGEVVRRQRGGAAVVMGALSPRTRNAQVELYQSGEVDFLVATDAIGMGLNMDVDHVALASLRKYDGHSVRPLKAHEIGQIAGRAGRYMNDGTFGTTGDASDLDPAMVEQIEGHRFDPVRVVQWRSRDLDFGSIDALIESLEAPPPVKGLARARAATDLLALRRMAEDPLVRDAQESKSDLQRLWEVCQIPDFRNMTVDEHVRLLMSVFKNLLDNGNRLPTDWLNGHLERLDRIEGDIDTLATRIAHVRTWTFVTNRAHWLEDAPHWQERARAIEDRLSDALHEGLTQRFIDRRTSQLIKSLRLKDDLVSEISAEGEVMVEGHYVGRLQGFQFVPDPRAHGVDGKALRAAAAKALRAMIGARAAQLAGAPDTAIELSDHGRLWWQGDPVARLVPGSDGVTPRVHVLGDTHLEAVEREAIETRLGKWLSSHIARIVPPLLDLREAVTAAGSDGTAVSAEQMVGGVAPLTGLARGIGFQLVENFGVLDRRDVSDQVRQLDQDGRAHLRRFGVRFGQYSIFLPALLKPTPARLLLTLWAVQNNRFGEGQDPDQPPPAPPQAGLCSVPLDAAADKAFYAAAGFRVCGMRAVRVDMLERLGDLIRNARGGPPAKPGKSGAKGGAKADPTPTPDGVPPTGEGENQDVAGKAIAATQESLADAPAQGDAPADEQATLSAAAPGPEAVETPDVGLEIESDATGGAPDGPSDTETLRDGDGPAEAAAAATNGAVPVETSAPAPEDAAQPAAAERIPGDAKWEAPPSASGTPEAEAEAGADASVADAEATPGDTPRDETVSEGSDEADTAPDDAETVAAVASSSEGAPSTQADSPDADPEPEPPAGPVVPDGAFKITPDMMSIVGCSGEEFESILRALGYRSQTIRAETEGQGDLVVWRLPSKRERERPGPRRDGQARAGASRGRGDGQRSDGARTGPGPRAGGQRPGGPPAGEQRGDHRRANGTAEASGNGARHHGDNRAPGDDRGRSGGKKRPGPHGDRRDGGRAGKGGPPGGDRRQAGGKGGGKGGGKAATYSSAPPGKGGGRKDSPIDPDSPFAVLAALKNKGS
ncbi:MAG: helicase-related protein [Alphaproteobacteria bacterium]